LILPKKPQISSQHEKSWIEIYYWIFIVGGVLILAASIFLIWRCKKAEWLYSRPLRREDDTEVKTIASSSVREIFRSGNTDSGVGDPTMVLEDQTHATDLASPPPLPEGWEKVFEEKSKNYYYYNTKTGESRWEVPTHAA